jgi:hypothetical protein
MKPRKPWPLFFASLSLALPCPAASAQVRSARSCNVTVDIVDNDPQGTHVRAAPAGAIAATLRAPGEAWIEAHLIGQRDDWFEIDRADLIDPGAGERPIFRGHGWLHRSVIGLSGMQNGGEIYRDHDEKSAPVDPHAAGDQNVVVLGCWGSFLQVRAAKGTGWTLQACLNMVTTCV